MNRFSQPIIDTWFGVIRRPRAYLIPVLPLLGAIVGFFLFSNAQNKYLDLHFTYGVLWFTFIAFLIGLGFSLPALKSAVLQLRGRVPFWLVLIPLVLATIATYFVLQHIEPRHRIQSDETILLSTARSMENLGMAGSCNQGYFSADGLECINLVQNFKTKSVPFFYSLIQSPEFPQGLSSQVVFNTTLALLIPTALCLFLALLIYSRSAWLATLTTALVLSHPTLLFQFHSASVEPWYLFFGAFAALVFVLLQQHLKSGTTAQSGPSTYAVLIVIAALVALAAQTRQESLASFGFILAPLLLHQALNVKQKTFFFAALALFILPVLWVVYSYRGFDFQAGENQAHGIRNLIEHLGIAWQVMTTAAQDGELVMPFIREYMWLAAIGFGYTLVQVMRKDAVSIKVLWLFLLALPQTLIIFENISGDMTIEINQRYSLVFIPLIALMGAQGLKMFADLLSLGRYHRLPLRAEAVVLVLICGLVWAYTARYQSSFEKNIMYRNNQLTTEEQELRNWYQNQATATEQLYVYARPWHFIAYGKSAIHYSTWQRLDAAERRRLAQRFDQEIYYARGMDCWQQETWHSKAVGQRITDICNHFERNNALQPLQRRNVTGSFNVEISRIDLSENAVIGPIEVKNLVTRIAAQNILIEGELRGCRAEVPVFWVWNSQRQAAQCRNGAFSLTLASAPGLGYLQLLSASDIVLWSRALLHPGDRVKSLLDLEPVFAEVGWKQLQFNRSNGGNPLTIDGVRYNTGLGAHAPSRISYEIPPGFTRLQFAYGLDDEEVGGDGVLFMIDADGKRMWQSQKVFHQEIFYAEVNITGQTRLDLLTEPGGNKNFDHSNWIHPVLVRD